MTHRSKYDDGDERVHNDSPLADTLDLPAYVAYSRINSLLLIPYFRRDLSRQK